MGSSPYSTIVLAHPAVSRKHATLHIDGALLFVRDAGSKNGTLVNGRRVSEARLEEGDNVSFGPVEFIVKRIDRSDAEVAIDLGDESVAAPVLLERGSTATMRVVQEHRTGSWLAALSALADLLLGEGDPALVEALAALSAGLYSPGAVSFSWGGKGEASVMAMWGESIDVERCAPLRSAIACAAEAAGLEPVLLSGQTAGPPPLVWAVLARQRETPWGFALMGGFP